MVKDSSGRNVFSGTNEERTPAMIIFGVDPETNYYLRTAESLDEKVDIIVVPTIADSIYNGEVPDTNTPTAELKEYLDDFVTYLQDEEANANTNQEDNVVDEN